MDKDHKLERYRRKDYSELVEFPVEIVGRDGRVRHYDFEESVRLYQRRMSFARIRFDDEELMRAELGHCRARVEQLRRSFFDLHGWEAGGGPDADGAEVAGEVAGFLLKVLRVRSRLDVAFTRVEDEGPCTTWYVRPPRAGGGLLLYVFRTDGEQARVAERGWRDLVERVSTRGGGDAERLVSTHHTDDLVLVLTGRGADVDRLALLVPEDGSDAGEPTPWDEIVECTRRGDLAAAFLRCRALVDQQPWHRDAYALGVALAVQLNRLDEAEDLAFVGASTFPDDPLMHHGRGFVAAAQGAWSAAVPHLEAALARDPGLTAARSLLTFAHLDAWRLWSALAVARLPDDVRVRADEVAHDDLRKAIVRVVAFGAWSAAALLIGAMLAMIATPAAWIPWGACLVLCAGGIVWSWRAVEAQRARLLDRDPTAALARLGPPR